MGMDNIINLRNDLEEKATAAAEASENNFPEEVELTPEDRERLDKMQKEAALVVEDRDDNGNATETPVEDVTKTIDEKIAKIATTVDGAEQSLKLLNSGDIKQTADAMKKEVREKALRAFRELSVSGEEIEDEDYIKINDQALDALQKYFEMDRLDADELVKKLSKKTMQQICSILPPEFVRIYTTEDEIKANNVKAKERLLASLSYLTVTGPELDYLNQYIDEENYLALVSKRLLQCQTDFSEMLKDSRTMSELIAETVAKCPLDDSFWAKHIKIPNRVHNEFAQRVVIQEKYKEAYTKILDEYPVISLVDVLDDPEKLAERAKVAGLNEKARKLINDEIAEADNKIKAYTNVVELTLMYELWPNVVQRFGPNNKKKVTMDFVVKEAVNAVDRVRRCKQNLPFPGYHGTEKNVNQIFSHYTTAYTSMLRNYNAAITTVLEKENYPDSDIEPIQVEGYDDNTVFMMFSTMLVILMGRIVKNLTKNTSDKYDAIMLDAYFQTFCNMGKDIYIMENVWALMKDFIVYLLNTYCEAKKGC